MNENQKRKKEEEKRALQAAGRASSLIPSEIIQDFEKPDFRAQAGDSWVGIEVTEILPVSESFSSPLAESSFDRRMMQLAERKYSDLPGALPVGVSAFFWKTESGQYEMETMARELAAFVAAHREEAAPVATFSWRADLPEGFGVITLCSTYDRPWQGCESVDLKSEQIYPLFARRISEKNARLPAYRTNLPDAPMYLLIYSCAGICRNVEIVHSMEEWEFAFDFDRVFFFSVLYNRVLEFRRA